MKDITNSFGTYFYPCSALVFYECSGGNQDSYVEYFDMDNGYPVNPHPLSTNEAKRLAAALKVDDEKMDQFRSDGILPSNLLSFNADSTSIIWYSKAQFRELHFSKNLGIKSGKAHIPPMIWKANRKTLQIYAMPVNRKPAPNTPLYHAPFFNVHKDGSVCMGTVHVETAETGSVNELMTLWESYFFNSYFSHLMADHNPVLGNCVLLWESLINNGQSFPTDMLVKTTKKLKDILL